MKREKKRKRKKKKRRRGREDQEVSSGFLKLLGDMHSSFG